MNEITLRGMRFHALIGILPHERTIPQPLEIDVTVRVAAGDGVLDYRRLYDAVASVAAAGPIDFLEEIADRVARRALDLGERVRATRVAVRKPHVPLGGPLDYVEVIVERLADA